MFDAGKNLGLPYLPDVNSSSTAANGCIKAYLTQNPYGTRSSTFSAFLPESVASSRKSWLHVCTNTSATKLDVQNADGTVEVHGVFLQPAVGSGQAVYVRARREVILCSGPLENPRILQLRCAFGAYGLARRLTACSFQWHRSRDAFAQARDPSFEGSPRCRGSSCTCIAFFVSLCLTMSS